MNAAMKHFIRIYGMLLARTRQKNLNFLVFPLLNFKAPPRSLRMCNNNKKYLSYAQQQHHVYNVIIGYKVLLLIYLRIANIFLVHTQIYAHTYSISSHNLISLRALIILFPLDDLFEQVLRELALNNYQIVTFLSNSLFTRPKQSNIQNLQILMRRKY